MFCQSTDYHETGEPEYEVVNISPVAADILDKLEDKLKETTMRRDNKIDLEEGILEPF